MRNSIIETEHKREMDSGQRFSFGDNWLKFLKLLDEQRIAQAVESLKKMLNVENLDGKKFLDIGCGSGLFSLAARRLGAHVYSFDYDPKSVACAKELKFRYYKDDVFWNIETGSVTDESFLESLGKFDVVYSWGVLHHTGKMWRALENITKNINENGKLFIAIYNDQGWQTKLWWRIKKSYVASPKYLRWIILIPCYVRLWGPVTVIDLLLLRPNRTWREYKNTRGMSPHRDVIDWVGGFPFEVSKPEEIFYFYKNKGFELCELKTCSGGLGCNEYVFRSLQKN